MSRENPRVTVLMPVYNGEKYLRKAIDSILNQTFTDFEFLIINDGSTDGSAEIVESYRDHRIRLVHNERNLKLIATLNRGIELARGDYIARMDCDDISLPERLAVQLDFLDTHPEIGVCGTWVETFGETDGEIWRYPTDPDQIKCSLLFVSALAHPSVMMRRDIFTKYKLAYDPADLHAEDWGLWQRCSVYFDLANIPRVLLRYRITAGSASRANQREQSETKRNLDRKSLQQLGIDPGEEQLTLHRQIAEQHFSDDRETLIRIRTWLELLQRSNHQKKIYQEPCFSEILAKYWWNACAVNTQFGMWLWDTFRASPLSELVKISFNQKVKLLIKCLIRYRPESIS